MGFNTTVVVINDALTDIENDPDFGKNLVAAIIQADRFGGRVDVPARGHVNAAHVVETHHADQTALVTVGGNLGIEHLTVYGYRHNERDIQVKLLTAFAEKLGFSLVAKD